MNKSVARNFRATAPTGRNVIAQGETLGVGFPKPNPERVK